MRVSSTRLRSLITRSLVANAADRRQRLARSGRTEGRVGWNWLVRRTAQLTLRNLGGRKSELPGSVFDRSLDGSKPK